MPVKSTQTIGTCKKKMIRLITAKNYFGIALSINCFRCFTENKIIFFYFSVMVATEAEMISAKLPIEERDYCAHTKIEYLACLSDHWPLAYRCAHEKHAQAQCQYDE